MVGGDPEAPVDCGLLLDANVVSGDPEAPVGCGLPFDADVVGMDTEARGPDTTPSAADG